MNRDSRSNRRTAAPRTAWSAAASVALVAAVGLVSFPFDGLRASDSDDSGDGDSNQKVASLDFIEKPSGDPEKSSTKKPSGSDSDEGLRHYDMPDHCGRVVVKHEKEKIDLPRVSADYEIDLRGDLATVVVRQTFKNPSDRKLEGLYEFPMYSEAAVYGMTMKIGDRKVEAQIKKKQEAREKYEKAKEKGKKAALLSQDRPNLFTQRVANIEPGQRVEITIRYTHPVPKDRGTYRLMVPLNLPERYTPANMENNKLVEGDGSEDPGSSEGGVPGSDGFENVDFSIRLDGSMPVSKVSSSSHKLKVHKFSSKTRWIELADGQDATDSHFRLNYRLSGKNPRVGIHSQWNKSKDEGYFDVLIEPPSDVSADSVPNREMVYVLDRSGSMQGERFQAARRFVKRAIEHLRPSDKLRIITFSNDPSSFRSKAVSATPKNVEAAQKWLDNQSSGGGTEMAKAVKTALKPKPAGERMRLVSFVTDVKVSNEFEVIKLVRKHVDNTRIFTMGIGPDPNSYLLDELARAGRGFSRQFQLDQNMEAFIDDSVRRLQNPVFTDISIDWGGLQTDGLTPSAVPDVFEGGSVRIHGTYSNPGKHTVEIKGDLSGSDKTFKKTVQFTDEPSSGEAVELAWARKRVDDYMHSLNTPKKLRETSLSEEKLKRRITQLGLDYSLTTQWTSFVAVAEGSDDGEPMANPQSSDDRRQEKSANRARPQKKASSSASRGGSATQGMSADSATSLGSGAVKRNKINKKKARKLQNKRRLQNKQGRTQSTGSKSQSSSKPDVTIEKVSVSGDLKKSLVRKVVRTQRRKLKHCYEEGLDRDSSLAGKAHIVFTVQKSGDVDKMSYSAFTVGSKDVRSCIKNFVEMWEFPKPDDGGSAKVSVVVTFETN